MIESLYDTDFLNNKVILITGGTGTLGNKLTEILLKVYKPKIIIIFSRDEYKQSIMQEKYSREKYPQMRYFLGDIRDYNRLDEAFRNVDIIFHTAALKQVPALEYNPLESIKTNVYGAENVIRAAIKNNVEKVMAISTDKAVNPINLYGACKLCFEKVFINANNLSPENGTIFSVARYGNVLGSRGSVLPLFLRQNDSNSGEFTVTDKSMTRFTITIEQAVNFILNCMNEMIGAEIFVPKLPSYNILQLATLINPSNKIKIIGIRPGEKLHESLIGEYESYLGIEFDNYFIIKPPMLLRLKMDHEKFYNGYKKLDNLMKYCSGDNEYIKDSRLDLYIREYISDQ